MQKIIHLQNVKKRKTNRMPAPNERFCVIAAVTPPIMQWELASYYPAGSSVEAATTQSRHHVARNGDRTVRKSNKIAELDLKKHKIM